VSVEAARSQVAILGARGHVAPSRPTASRPAVRLVAFAALALYGTLRWGTLLAGRATPRLLGLLALAVLLAGGRPPLARRSRPLAALATLVALLAAFPIAGVPLAWVVNLRIAVTANAIGDGLSALPQALVPYTGVNQWVTMVIVLGAAVLLFDAALLVAFAPRVLTDLRRAGAALPLVALAAVPTTLIRPGFPYLDGLLLFALLAAFGWGERIGPARAGGALGVCVLAALAAMFAGPALDRHRPWINPRTLAGGLTPSAVESFDWSQGYGPIDWPHADRVVAEVEAPHPAYWKAENLDFFNGEGWTQAAVGTTPPPSPAAARRWTQTLTVTVGDMKIPQVIGAGTITGKPVGLGQPVQPGASPGTWTAASNLEPGDSYRVTVYTPEPSSAQLEAAGEDYRGVAAGYRTIELPPLPGSPSPDENYIVGNRPSPTVGTDQSTLVFPAFHSPRPVEVSNGPPGEGLAGLLAQYHYGRVYELARQLAAGAATPYDFAHAVMRYLRRGYVYSEHPPPSGIYPPLVSFLLHAREGYCQQFAGAMALLLRMGGVPARVAVGFTPGHLDSATGRWLVTDLDAHAWVEAWFPRYGWLTFDPTPPVDPALAGNSPIPAALFSGAASGIVLASASKQVGHHTTGSRARSRRRALSTARGGGTPAGPLLAVVVAVLALAAGLAWMTRPRTSAEALVAELERALRRLGRPVPAGGTLAGLERRLSGSAEASAYVRALRLTRFAGAGGSPTRGQRRALRRQLCAGRGPLARLRAMWALPPRWGRPPGWAPGGGRPPGGGRGSRATARAHPGA
jgi:transglutaminase-like putative cysteine protease